MSSVLRRTRPVAVAVAAVLLLAAGASDDAPGVDTRVRADAPVTSQELPGAGDHDEHGG